MSYFTDREYAANPDPADAPVQAQPFEARQCPVCKKWIYTAAGPFAEGDPSKPLADFYHWASEHVPAEERTAAVVAAPFFDYNDRPVTAVRVTLEKL